MNSAIAKTRNQPKRPLAEDWIKTWHMYTMKCHLAIKKNEIMSSGWMQLEIVILTEVGQTEKEQYHMAFPVCGI